MRIHLYWHTDDADVNLGEAYVDGLPPVGALIAYPGPPVHPDEPRPGSWRVATVQIYPAMPGSHTALYSHEGGQLGIYNVFVEPAEGPFHP